MTTPSLIILAGGSSSRMWPLHEKLLMRFGEEPLLTRQLRHYAALGFHEMLIVANPENVGAIRSLSGQVDGLAVEIVVQELRAAWAMRCSRPSAGSRRTRRSM